MRHTSPSLRTNGVAVKNGSSRERSTIGPSKTRSKLTPPSWLTARPIEFR